MGKKARFTLLELLIIVAIMVILLSLLLPALRSARERGKQAVCRNNLKQLITAAVMYSSDNKSAILPCNNIQAPGFPFPATYLCWWELLAPDYINLIPDCPSDTDKKGYGLNNSPAVVDKLIMKVPYPTKTLYFICSSNKKQSCYYNYYVPDGYYGARRLHNNGHLFIMFDGHAEWAIDIGLAPVYGSSPYKWF